MTQPVGPSGMGRHVCGRRRGHRVVPVHHADPPGRPASHASAFSAPGRPGRREPGYRRTPPRGARCRVGPVLPVAIPLPWTVVDIFALFAVRRPPTGPAADHRQGSGRPQPRPGRRGARYPGHGRRPLWGGHRPPCADDARCCSSGAESASPPCGRCSRPSPPRPATSPSSTGPAIAADIIFRDEFEAIAQRRGANLHFVAGRRTDFGYDPLSAAGAGQEHPGPGPPRRLSLCGRRGWPTPSPKRCAPPASPDARSTGNPLSSEPGKGTAL